MRILNIGALLLLLYFWLHSTEYYLIINENNSLSRSVVNLLQNHTNISYCVFVLLFIYLVINLFLSNRWRYVGILISTLILELGILVVYSELALETVTEFRFFNIFHSIPLSIKLTYLNSEVLQRYIEISPQIAKYSIEELFDIKTHIESSVDLAKVSILNARELTEYSQELVSNGFNSIKWYWPITPNYHVIVFLVGASVLHFILAFFTHP